MAHHSQGACLRALGQNLTDEELKDLITSVDQDNSGTIDFDEFLALIVSKSEAINCEEELLAAFQEFDLAKKGKITKDQFYYIFCGMAETCEQQEIDYMLKLFGAVDENDEVAYPIVVNKLLEI
eukprot:753606-Hanusia_phi.AAC.2